MKNLLAITIMIAMVTTVTAGMYLNVDGLECTVDGTTKTLIFTGTNVAGFMFNLMPDCGVLSNGVVSSQFNIVSDHGMWAEDYGESGWVHANAFTTLIDGVNGILFTINYDSATNIHFYQSAFTGPSSIIFTDGREVILDIPEPMTMTLMAFGLVFLRIKS